MIVRSFLHRACRRFLTKNSNAPAAASMVNIFFVTPEGVEKPVAGKVGQDLLTLAHENDIDLEGIHI